MSRDDCGPSNRGRRIVYDDLRGWLAEAERLGELRRVAGASWEEEIGMAAALVGGRDDGPAVLFDDIPGIASGFRVLVNIFAGRRKAMCLGFPPDLDKVALSEAFAAAYPEAEALVAPVEVADGPVLANALTGDAVDLGLFPAPLWHEGDGGRYIGTGSYNVTRDPETGWVNLGVYRLMVQDSRHVGHNVLPGRHAAHHLAKYAARGEPMPMVMVVGGDPLTFIVAGLDVAEGVSEFDVVGALRGKPVALVRGALTGLPFPADAEIVLEGFVHPDRLAPEGPFGDWTGTYTEKGRINPVVEIAAIYHRDDPILLGFPPQFLPDEFSRLRAITRSALLKRDLAAAGVPGVVRVWAHEVGGSRMLTGIALRQLYPGHARQAGHVAGHCRTGVDGNRWVIVTDDDIDVANLEELIWAALTRGDPATKIDVATGGKAAVSDPQITPEQRAARDFTNSRLIIDACKPYHWRDAFPEINKPSADLARRAREKFAWLVE